MYSENWNPMYNWGAPETYDLFATAKQTCFMWLNSMNMQSIDTYLVEARSLSCEYWIFGHMLYPVFYCEPPAGILIKSIWSIWTEWKECETHVSNAHELAIQYRKLYMLLYEVKIVDVCNSRLFLTDFYSIVITANNCNNFMRRIRSKGHQLRGRILP